MISFVSTLEQLNYNIWSYHIPVSPEITKEITADGNRRVICQVNNIATIHSALMPLDQGSYILVNKQVRNQLTISEGDKVQITLEKDTSEYGMPMPDSFRVLLDQDEIGSEYFHALTPGKQRGLIYVVGKIKNLDSQLNKGMAILEHLTERKGQLDYKALNVKIKEYNQRSKMR
ncbi:MAG: prefoldin subunit 5 [Roseivirga sp.]|jgi:prefoldin subunit 5